tara:strand:+ start:173 stop:346 length:174 start_codon:yes stop_codon:yes gene_type:complete
MFKKRKISNYPQMRGRFSKICLSDTNKKYRDKKVKFIRQLELRSPSRYKYYITWSLA